MVVEGTDAPDIMLKSVRQIFTKFTSVVHCGTEINASDFGIKGQISRSWRNKICWKQFGTKHAWRPGEGSCSLSAFF